MPLILDYINNGQHRFWKHVPLNNGEILPIVIEHPNKKLTEDQVRKIREEYKTGLFFQRELGVKYGVTQSVIGDIVNYKVWKHV